MLKYYYFINLLCRDAYNNAFPVCYLICLQQHDFNINNIINSINNTVVKRINGIRLAAIIAANTTAPIINPSEKIKNIDITLTTRFKQQTSQHPSLIYLMIHSPPYSIV